MGQAPETGLRSCVLATRLARSLDLPKAEVRDVCLGSLLRHVGCTATAALEARLFGGDELVSRTAAQPADFGNARDMLGLTFATGRGSGVRRPVLVARAMLGDLRHGTEILENVCDAASLLADRLRLGQGVRRCLEHQFERWDGKGPFGLAREEIALPARVSEVATQAVLWEAIGGADRAVAVVQSRAGSWFDPQVAASFRHFGPALMRELTAGDPWQLLLESEPAPVASVDDRDLDRVAGCFADMVDLKSPYTLGHSSGVARLAEDAARLVGLGRRETVTVRRAALLHDLGRIGVSSGIWEKAARLSRSETEQIRMHPYHTERILSCSSALEPLGRIAGLHHERLDGSGYHHGVSASALPMSARLLAVADAYQTATQGRPHRPASTGEQAAERIAAEAAQHRLDSDCVAAVIEVAGQARPRMRRAWPAGLSDREVEVVRLVARGLGNRGIAARLGISTRTAEHHVQHVYAKIGHSTRAGAALFAMEHDLLGPDDGNALRSRRTRG
jgi:HD-GYP domain-containing protein (c-di-GMP phosphodiesterase class II)